MRPHHDHSRSYDRCADPIGQRSSIVADDRRHMQLATSDMQCRVRTIISAFQVVCAWKSSLVGVNPPLVARPARRHPRDDEDLERRYDRLTPIGPVSSHSTVRDDPKKQGVVDKWNFLRLFLFFDKDVTSLIDVA